MDWEHWVEEATWHVLERRLGRRRVIESRFERTVCEAALRVLDRHSQELLDAVHEIGGPDLQPPADEGG